MRDLGALGWMSAMCDPALHGTEPPSGPAPRGRDL